MKKILAIFLSFFVVLGLASCGKQEDPVLTDEQKVQINVDESYTSIIQLTPDEMKDKMDNKEDFFILLAQTTCSHCAAFKPILNEVVQNKHYEIFYVDRMVTKLVDYEYTPTLVFFKKGEILKLIDPTGNEDIFSDYDKLLKFIDTYAIAK